MAENANVDVTRYSNQHILLLTSHRDGGLIVCDETSGYFLHSLEVVSVS